MKIQLPIYRRSVRINTSGKPLSGLQESVLSTYFSPSSVFFVLYRGIYHITAFITVSKKLGADLIVAGEKRG